MLHICVLALVVSGTVASAQIDPSSPIRDALERAEARVQAIIETPADDLGFNNVFVAIDDIIAHLQIDTNMLQFMAYVSTDPAERELGERAEADYTNFLIALGKNEKLYQAAKTVMETKIRLDQPRYRLQQEIMRQFRRNGMELSPEKRDELKRIQMEITNLQIAFNRNLNDDETTVLLTRAELAGMPDAYIANLKESNGLFFVTLDYPTFLPIMDYCESETARQKVWTAFKRRGGKKNVALLERLLKLRTDAAHLLGYDSPSAFECEIRMSKSPDEVKAFYERLRPLVREKAKRDWAEYVAAKREVTGDANATLQPWDQQFIEKKLQQSRYAVDGERVRQYFPLERVIDGLFSITQSLYGLEYREITDKARSGEVKDRPFWHEDVRLFEVWDKAANAKLGEFYIDLHPRPNKYGHAAQWGLVQRKKWLDGSVTLPLAALVCNFTKPTESQPSLLRHDEVETFFHEFGHCLHTILTESDFAMFSGTSVEGDFVEAPSQMFENWVWDADVLNTFAGHYQTGEPLPKELLDGMIAARNLGSGMLAERQFYYGIVDQVYHSSADGVVDTTQVSTDLFPEFEMYEKIPNVYYQASFGHFANPGYTAGYYGYQWSLVYACDMFNRFKELGMLNPEAGMMYRKAVLAPGGLIDAIDQIKNFLGREPRMEAYVEHLGLTVANP